MKYMIRGACRILDKNATIVSLGVDNFCICFYIWGERENADQQLTKDKNMNNLEIKRTGTLKIVSSGYTDRFAMATTYMIIHDPHLNINYRIDNDKDRVNAILSLQGTPNNKITDALISKTIELIYNSPLTIYATYTDSNGYTIHELTSIERINAGINVATGCKDLSPYDIETHSKIAQTLTKGEWEIIRTGLTKINQEHELKQRAIVTFDIP